MTHPYEPGCLCKRCRHRTAGEVDRARVILDEEDDEAVREVLRARLRPDEVAGELLRERDRSARLGLAIEQAQSYLASGLLRHAEKALSSALGAR